MTALTNRRTDAPVHATGTAGSDEADHQPDHQPDRRASDHQVSTQPGVDLAVLRAQLDGRWATIRNRARVLADDPLFAPVFDLPREQYRAHVSEQVRALAASGMPRLGLPESVGGENDVGASVTAFEMLAFGDLSLLVKAGVQWGLVGGSILHLGTERHHARYLDDIASFALPGCFAMTETGHGSDVAAIRTTATFDRDAGEFVLTTPDRSAYKDYIGNAARDGRIAVVFAQLRIPGPDETFGVHAFVVPIRDERRPAVHGRPHRGLRPEGRAERRRQRPAGVHDVRVPRDALLNRYSDVAADGTYTTSIPKVNARFFTMIGTLSRAGSALPAVRAAPPRLRWPSRCATPSAGASSSHRTATRRCCCSITAPPTPPTARCWRRPMRCVSPRPTSSPPCTRCSPRQRVDETRRELEAQAAGIKAVATWHATAAIQTAREACGGAGYLAENLLPGMKADTDIFTTFEGDNTVLLQLVAKELLTNYRTAFGELDTLGVVRFAGRQVLSSVVERTAARTLVQRLLRRRTRPRRGRRPARPQPSSRTVRVAGEARLDGVARRLRRVGQTGPGAFAGFNEAQDHLIKAARVHVDRLVLEAFVAGIARCPAGPTRDLLGTVCDLYALSTIEADKGWFLEHGRLDARRAKALTRTVNELCGRLRPHARLLVDGFGIPPAAIDVPLLRD